MTGTTSLPYDIWQRRAAARAQAAHGGWLVLWGPGSRRFWAFPLFQVPAGTMIQAVDLGALLAALRDAEDRFRDAGGVSAHTGMTATLGG